MIGYIQSSDIDFWNAQMRAWLKGLVEIPVDGWTLDDQLRLAKHDKASRTALLESVHRRSELQDIRLHHLWIDMGGPKTE
jgi:hypothetical protein